MKTILSLALTLALITSCKVYKEKLELNLTKGETYYQKIVADASVVQTVNGQQMNMYMNITGKTAYKVIAIMDSIYDMEVKYESLSMKMSMQGGLAEFSSEKNDERDIFSTILGMLKNRPFYVKMSKSGKIKEIKNIDSLFLNMFDKAPLSNLTDEQQQEIKKQVMQAYGEKAFKGNIEMISSMFSNSAVSKGDKWITNTQLESGFSANVESTYELKEIADTFCIINGKSKIKTSDKDAYIQANGMPIKYDMTGTMTSEIKIHKNSGWIIDAKLIQNFSGNAQIKDNPQVPGGMIIPITMKNEQTITEK